MQGQHVHRDVGGIVADAASGLQDLVGILRVPQGYQSLPPNHRIQFSCTAMVRACGPAHWRPRRSPCEASPDRRVQVDVRRNRPPLRADRVNEGNRREQHPAQSIHRTGRSGSVAGLRVMVRKNPKQFATIPNTPVANRATARTVCHQRPVRDASGAPDGGRRLTTTRRIRRSCTPVEERHSSGRITRAVARASRRRPARRARRCRPRDRSRAPAFRRRWKRPGQGD